MNIIYLLLALSVLVALIFFIAFIFSVKKGQYDDVYTPSVRMLFDDELVKSKSDKSNSTKNKKSNSLWK
ncbi:cbb3-type cytochrome oxidase assembly protein CcoS [Salegentibacter sp. JZCK2]|uniref:cbb3-type cytochrome oxidase assembly protein CcoS n=1 Tax=Salegentibacter tibetensis TaxID=2873600 RepID=UPI001CCE7C8C|nr:cbb3-type cytochrome oxidase assembly protein CcoS [Salegentibacter tibetensis]MBZ9729255.1 cbb3-type cytochrome oxidase assembly protein CcoS [Salegentibacter tibetensis]